MRSNGKNNRFTFNSKYSNKLLSEHDWCKVEDLLARLIAQAYAEDHPEQFNTDMGGSNEQNKIK